MRLATIERISKKIAEIRDEPTAHAEAVDLYQRIEKLIVKHKALIGYFPTDLSSRSGVEIRENGFPYFVQQYWNVISPSYATSLTFVLENGKLSCIARLLHLVDGKGAASENIKVAGVKTQRLEETVTFFNVEGLVKVGVMRTLEFRIQVLHALGFTVSMPTLKKLTRAAAKSAGIAF